MENSFSLEFNPLTNVKAVKEYEEEIQKLKRENFELKAHLTHVSAHPATDNLPRILYEQNEKMAQIAGEKDEAVRQLREAQEMLGQLGQAKMLLENKYSQDVFANSEKAALLEDENKRLLLRVEKFNKEIGEVQKLRGMLSDAEKLNADYKNFIQNLESQIDQTKFDFNNQIQEYEARLEEMRHSDAASRKHEQESLRKMYDSEVTKNKNNTLMINDLKATVTNEIRERTRLQGELGSVEERTRKECQEKIEHMESHFRRIQKECEGFAGGLNKFKTIISGKLRALSEEAGRLGERVLSTARECTISSENQKFIEKLKVRGPGVNTIIEDFRKIVLDAHRKIDVLRKEASDATFFAENNKKTLETKTAKLLEEFHKQFGEAKTELSFCRRYLEKKSAENKSLKNENARLVREISLRPVDLSKRLHDGLPTSLPLKHNVK